MSRQWFQPTFRNRLSQDILLANFSIQYGRFYDISDYLTHFCFPHSIDKISALDNPYNDTSEAGGTRIASMAQHGWGHCGRDGSPSGTEGSFQVLLHGNDEKIAEIYWESPFSGSNKLEKRYVKSGYSISFDGFNFSSGPLRDGTISIRVD